MNNRKNYNSIVFLTTLSVYLGLVLVGAPPQALAQAALTRQFDIQTEIELEDDLDKNPDEQALDSYSSALQNLYALARDFSEKNRENLRGGYEFDCSAIFRADLSKTITCQGGSGLFWGGFTSPIKEISKAFPHISDEKIEQTRVNLILSGTDFFLKSSFNQESDWKAEQTSNFYDNALSRIKIEKVNNPRLIIYENTKITHENNQVFVVTRLPRASIDALLAKNAQ
jgi:hypothetical protein